MKEQTLTEMYIEYMFDFEEEKITKMIEERFKEEIFNWGQERYDDQQKAE